MLPAMIAAIFMAKQNLSSEDEELEEEGIAARRAQEKKPPKHTGSPWKTAKRLDEILRNKA